MRYFKKSNFIYFDNWDVNKPRKPGAPNMQNWGLNDPANSKDIYEVIKTGKLGVKADKVVKNNELTIRKVQHKNDEKSSILSTPVTSSSQSTYCAIPKKLIFESNKRIDERLVKLLKNFLKLKLMENFIDRKIYEHIYTLYKCISNFFKEQELKVEKKLIDESVNLSLSCQDYIYTFDADMFLLHIKANAKR